MATQEMLLSLDNRLRAREAQAGDGKTPQGLQWGVGGSEEADYG